MPGEGIHIKNSIVIIDDSEVVAECIKNHLGMAGYSNVQVFTDPQEAIKNIQEYECPAFIITDFDMPGMNGVELLNTVFAAHPKASGLIVTSKSQDVLAITERYPVMSKNIMGFYDALIEHIRQQINTQ